MTWVEKYKMGELSEEVREYEATIVGLEGKIGQLVMELGLEKKRSDTALRRVAVDRLRATESR